MNAILPPTGERLLADAIRRAQRSGHQQLLVLHLDSVPVPRPHHRRIARALLLDAAAKHGGQLFPMRNGDLVLLTAIGHTRIGHPRIGHPIAPPGGAKSAPLDPAQLPATFAELFKADRPDPAGLVSLWSIDHDQSHIFQYLQALLNRQPVSPPEDEVPPPPNVVEDIASLLATARIGDLTQRQTAVDIRPGGGVKAMLPLFREITFSVEVLESRLAVTGRASRDPYLFRHLAARLDPRMMVLVLEDLGRPQPDTPRLHFNLTIETLLSAAFARFADRCAELAGAMPGIEVPLIEACRDPVQFAAARQAVQARGFPLVIEGVTPLGLRFANPASFGADLVKLDWEKSMAATPPLIAAIERLGAERIILQRAQTEQAIVFGLAHGITRFQGRHIDAMLAAARLGSCPHAQQCSLRQCSERAAATAIATRRFCLNHPLLDRGLPESPA